MIKTSKISGNVRKELTKLFRQTRKDVAPWLDEYRMNSIDVRWWNKPERKTRMGTVGKCYQGLWTHRNLNGKRQYTRNLIILDKRLLEQPDELYDCWKHELIHLVEKSKGHDRIFKNLINACGASMYHSFND